MATNVARSYTGDAADRYFAYQHQVGELGADLNKRKFQDHVLASDTVVDLGCGAGGLLEKLEAGRKIGVEVSVPAREAAIKRGIRVVASTAELEDSGADVVISNHALEHMLSPFDELRGAIRILRPGGKLVIWLPMDDWRSEADPTRDLNHHLFTWTPLLLHNLLTEAGFAVREAHVVTHAWPPMTERLVGLPRPVFDALAWAWSVSRRRRQVMAVAFRPA